MKKVFGLVAKTSTIPNAGLGLFLKGYEDEHGEFVDVIKKGQIVTH
jgi:hypothetical protein